MKILHVYRTCFPETKGGLEQVIRFITQGVQHYGIESKILSLSDEADKNFSFEGTEIILKKKSWEISSNGFSWGLISEFRKLADWADVINYHYPWPSGDVLSLFAKSDKPSVVTYHSDIVKQRLLKHLYKPLERHFLTNVSRIIATSPQYVETSLTLRPFKNKCSVIPLGIEPDSYPPAKTDNLAKWQQTVGTGFYLFVGVLRYYKGLHYLIDAAEISGLPVIIAGNGPLREELEARVSQKKLQNVRFVGHISDEDKISLLTLCKAFVFPSHLRSEAFGISLLEAQLFAKPIISCEVGSGSSYVNSNGETGFIVPAGDVRAIADCMMRLESDPQLCKAMGDKGRQRMLSMFTAKEMARRYAEVYQELV
ncbi:glycosyltransferase [Rahnella sp. SAP-1]|uniref:Glycosyltransferase n=1 Tax=Rouxiella aceris TaxID=2703884 RepID=A0A848MLS2_9GAMM|nr:glycosyltransferase [Rouxiella aceris]